MGKISNSTPRADGYIMPAEFAPHDGTLMIYPTRPGSWGKDRTATLKSFGAVFAEILKREKLYLLLPEGFNEEAGNLFKQIFDTIAPGDGEDRKSLEKKLILMAIPSDDAWARDVGPTVLVKEDVEKRAVNWSFNAWGGEVDGLYASWDKDDKVAIAFCKDLDLNYYDAAPFVLEGGSIHSDGEGTVMVTESCLLSAGRNPHLTKEQIEEKLLEYLGAKKVLWLPSGIYNDETNEHVDNVCAFTAPGEVVLAWTDNKEDPQYKMSLADLEYLESVTDARGRKLTIHKLPVPDRPVLVEKEDLDNYEFEDGEDVREVGERLAASYVNYYVINGAVLIPQFGAGNEASDARALEIMKPLFPDREVVGIDARAILLGGGNIHCITQQIPEG